MDPRGYTWMILESLRLTTSIYGSSWGLCLGSLRFFHIVVYRSYSATKRFKQYLWEYSSIRSTGHSGLSIVICTVRSSCSSDFELSMTLTHTSIWKIVCNLHCANFHFVEIRTYLPKKCWCTFCIFHLLQHLHVTALVFHLLSLLSCRCRRSSLVCLRIRLLITVIRLAYGPIAKPQD